MRLHLADWRIDLALVLSIAGVLVSFLLSRKAHQLRRDTPKGMLTQLERSAFTLTERGDIFRLVSQLGWLFLLLAIVLFQRPGTNVLIAAWIVGQGSVPVHSLLLLRGTRRAVEKLPGTPASKPPEYVEQPSERGEDHA